MKLTLPLKMAVNFSPPIEFLGYTKLWQENILHQATCDTKTEFLSLLPLLAIAAA